MLCGDSMKPAYRIALALALACRLGAADNSVPQDLFHLSDPNLEVTLWASTPQLRNPTNLDFDQDGRIWVAEGVNYRGHYNRQPAGDRIVILEDTDGDGRADRTDVFVQEPGLRAPMGIAVIDNRVVVSMAPDIIVYTDVNRDRKFDPAVDKKEVLLTGFNGRVHDHTVHSVSVGPDGQWYWNAGNCGALFTDRSGKTFRVGSSYDPTYGGGKGDLGWRPTEIAGQLSDDGHVWVGGFAARMNPDGTRVRIIGHNFRNSYEQTVSSFGDVFQNDNDDPPACRTAFLLEYGNAGFSSFDGKRSWNADRRPGQSVPVAEWRQEDPGTMPPGDVYGGGSPTGIAFYEDGALGAKYRGLLLSCEPGRNVVFGYLPQPEGAGFRLERFDFLTTNPEGQFAGTDFQGGRNEKKDMKTMFRPSDVSVGPDGAVYVTDWFDARVGGHADWDETTSGSIYRIAPKGFKPKVPKVDYAGIDGAIAGLRSPAVNVRGAAQAALAQQGAKATKSLSKLLKDENPYVRARAVWLLARDGGKGARETAALLDSPDAQTRIVAFRALRRVAEQGTVDGGRKPEKLPGTPEFLRAAALKLASDPSPGVRREAVLAMRDLPLEQSREVLLAVARTIDGSDRTLLEAWGAAAAGKESAVYDLVKPVLNDPDPLKWGPGFASIAWRLHPPQSVDDFKKRALSPSLGLRDRRDALTAIGYNESAGAAKAMVEIAATADGAVKADAMWWLINRKDNVWKAHGLGPELKSRKLYDPESVELISATIPAAEPAKYTVAEVARLTGDVQRGKDRFSTFCTSCHRAGDDGVEYAPNLSGWTRRQTAEVFFNSVINPSADIAHGFNGTALKLKDEVEIHGIVISDGDPVVVQSAAGVIQTVPRNRIASRGGLGRSLMMSADQLGVQPQDLADIHAYLRTK